MEPLDARTIARLEISRRVVPVKPISTLGAKISPPVARSPKSASLPRGLLGEVVAAVCEAWMISPGDLLSRWRPHRISYPRYAAMKLTRKLTRASYPQIGVMFDKDHSSVIHAMKRACVLLQEDSAWRACYLRALATLETQDRGATAGDGSGTGLRTPAAPAVAKPVSAGPCLSPVAAGRAPDAMSPKAGIGRSNSRGAA